MKILFAFAGLLAIFPSIRLAAQAYPASQQNLRNAAVAYLRADASLRQSYPLPTDAPAKLQKALESPLDDEDEKLVAAADEALLEFNHAASSKLCDWEMSVVDGALTNTAHRGALIELASVSGLRARLRFRAGNAAGAISDVLAAMAAARHLSTDGSLASVLFAYKLENTLNGIIAQNLFGLSPEQLTELTTELGFAAWIQPRYGLLGRKSTPARDFGHRGRSEEPRPACRNAARAGSHSVIEYSVSHRTR